MDRQVEIDELKKSVKELTAQVNSLITVWEQAKGILVFIKWCSSAAAALATFIVFIKPYLK